MIDRAQEFKERLEQVHNNLMGAKLSLVVWKGLALHDQSEVAWTRERQTQILRRWSGVFTPVVYVIQQMALMQIAKVVDIDRRSVSLPKLVNEAQQDRSLVPRAQPSDLRELRRELTNSRNTLNAILQLRHQKLAHTDEAPDELAPLLLKEVETLVDDLRSSLNSLFSWHDGSSYDWDLAVEEAEKHVSSVLQILDGEVEREQRRFDDEMVDIATDEVARHERVMGRPLTEEEKAHVARGLALTPEQERRVRGTSTR